MQRNKTLQIEASVPIRQFLRITFYILYDFYGLIMTYC